MAARIDIKVRNVPVPWNVGEHVAIIGTTGTGKTYLMSRLLSLRKYVAVVRTKADDIKFTDYKRVKDASALDSLRDTRLLIEPEFSQQRNVVAETFAKVWSAGGWTLVVDELFYAIKVLRLQVGIEMLLTQGRSKRISIVTGMQRPVHVTRFALSEVSHVFTFRLEGRDAKTISDMTSQEFAIASTRVPRFHFAHYHVPTRTIGVGTADHLDRVLLTPNA